jgi:large subunit ribosomal protein L35
MPTEMPKQKTHKATVKRFRVTKNGKVQRRRNGRRHLMLNKNRKRVRNLGKGRLCEKMDARRVRRLLCLA